MELDKRIRDIADIKSVINSSKEIIGKMGYLAKTIKDFKDLNKCKYATVDDYKEDDECFCHIIKVTAGLDATWYSYFIPEESLKPIVKKYRPYTLNEFVSLYDLGDEVIVRLKDKENISHKLFVEYDENDDDDMVCLGSIWYELTELYDSFEIYTGDGWKPFGKREN